MQGSIDTIITALDYCTTSPNIPFTGGQLREMEQLCNDFLAGKVVVICGVSSLELLQSTPAGSTLPLFASNGGAAEHRSEYGS